MRKLLLGLFLLFIIGVNAQLTSGFTTVGVNGGGSVNAPNTEILQFDNYDDATAGTANGQDFVFILQNGDSLFFTLTRTGYAMSAVVAPSYIGAPFGQFGYTGITGETVLYQAVDASNTGMNFGNIHMKDPSGATVPNYTIVIIDGEATNVGETLSITLAQQYILSFWDSITPSGVPYGLPPQTGLGTNEVTWGPAPESDNYKTAYAVAANSPGNIAINITHQNAGLEGIAVGVGRSVSSFADTICSGSMLNINPQNVGGNTYTWPVPVVNPPGSLTGATAQETGVSNMQQTLTNNTFVPASVIYTVTPKSNGVAGQPFTVTIVVKPPLQAVASPSLCSDSTAQLIAKGTGVWISTFNNPGPVDIHDPTSDTALVSGLTENGIYRFVRTNEGCSDTVSVYGGTVAKVQITSAANIFCVNDSTSICATPGFSSYNWNTGETGSCIEAKDAGNYYVTATDASGCTAESNHLAISEYPVPSVSIVVVGDTLTSFGSITYQWYLNNAPIPGATLPLYIAQQPGVYSLAVTDKNGCITLSNSFDVTDGISELNEQRLLVFPNPSTGAWQLTADNSLIGSVAELYDEDGRLLGSYEIQTAKCEIAANVPSGIYWLRISSANFSIVRKLVKF